RRHRGSVVAEGASSRATLQCPDRAWTYGLDGALLAAPRADREIELETEELGLLPIAVDTWGPLVFANPDRDAPPLADVLGRLPALVAEAGGGIGSLEFRPRAGAGVDASGNTV